MSFSRKITLGAFIAGSVLSVLVLSAVILNVENRTEKRVSAAIDRFSEQIRMNLPANLGNDRVSVRGFMIHSQLAQTERPIILVGDSITEGALVPSSVCGHPVVNAGIGGMTVGSYFPIAQKLLVDETAEMIVIELGTNDSIIPAPTSGFEAAYSQLIDFLAPHTGKLVLSGLPPFDMNGSLAKTYFDQPSGDRNDASVRMIAGARSLPFIDLRKDLHGSNLTVDGVHLNAAGYDQWRVVVLAHIRSSLGCSTTG